LQNGKDSHSPELEPPLFCLEKWSNFMRIFTVWGQQGNAHTLVSGEAVPRLANGKPLPDCDELIWRIEAGNWEEAMAIYHLRQGWEPYQPALPAESCPKCNALFYPHGSGQCWQCDFQS
jgi:hypothetical protein